MASQGFEPNLLTCLKCNELLKPKTKRYLAHDRLGFYCEAERYVKGSVVSDKVLKILRYLLNSNISVSKRVKSDKRIEKEIKNITHIWVESIIEKGIKSKKFL